jgi:hypothetical protein
LPVDPAATVVWSPEMHEQDPKLVEVAVPGIVVPIWTHGGDGCCCWAWTWAWEAKTTMATIAKMGCGFHVFFGPTADIGFVLAIPLASYIYINTRGREIAFGVFIEAVPR